MVQGRLLTRSQLAWCSTLPDISILRAELCSILSSSSSNISQSLMHHQQNLSQSLATLASSDSSSQSDSSSDLEKNEEKWGIFETSDRIEKYKKKWPTFSFLCWWKMREKSNSLLIHAYEINQVFPRKKSR